MNATIEKTAQRDPVEKFLKETLQSLSAAFLGLVHDTVSPVLRKRSSSK